MLRSRRGFAGLVAVGAGLGFAGAARAAVYTDTTGSDHYGGNEADIAGVTITNDASNITFTIKMNSAADLGTNHYANYEVGIRVGNGAGGQTAINGTFGTANPAAGNPYGNAVGISTGENFFVGSFLDNPPTSAGGAQLYQYSSSTGWSQVGPTAPITEVPTGAPSTTFSFPLSALGLSAGSTFKFDVWTTFGSPQGAYDALDNPNTPPGTAPYSGGTYDSATAAGSTFAAAVYTVTGVPEPTSAATLLAASSLGLLKRRRW